MRNLPSKNITCLIRQKIKSEDMVSENRHIFLDILFHIFFFTTRMSMSEIERKSKDIYALFSFVCFSVFLFILRYSAT